MAPQDTFVAVFADRSRDELHGALVGGGLSPHEFEIGTDEAERTARRGEQNEEADRGVFALQAGVVLPSRSAKAATVAIPLVAAIGIVLMLAFAFLPMGERSVAERILWVAITGAAMGGTIAFIVASAMGADDPFAPSAADRGLAVIVRRADAPTERLLEQLRPIRLDRQRPDGTLEKVHTEQDRRTGGALEEIEATVVEESQAAPHERSY